MNTHSLDLELSSSQYAHHADAAEFDITGDISIEAWIKLEQLPSTAGSIFSIVNKYDSVSGSYRSYLFVIGTDDKLAFTFAQALDGSANTTGTCDTAFGAGDVGVWRHVAVTVDVSASTFTFYIDGVAKNTTYTAQLGTSIVNSTAPFMVGARTNTVNPEGFFDGLIDEVRLWSDIRTIEEIVANWKTELVGNEANLSAYYKFNNDANDGTASGNNLTLVGTPVYSTSVPFGGGARNFGVIVA